MNVNGTIGANLYQLNDVNDNITGSVDQYILTYNSSSNNWYSAPGATLKGSIRLYVAASRTNGNAFYFNANTRTSDSSASPSSDSAFMVTTALLTKATLFLRQENAGPNNITVGLSKNANGSAFSTATLFTSSSLSLNTDTVQTYVFTGLTINQFDSIHFYCDPTNSPGQLYGIVIIE